MSWCPFKWYTHTTVCTSHPQLTGVYLIVALQYATICILKCALIFVWRGSKCSKRSCYLGYKRISWVKVTCMHSAGIHKFAYVTKRSAVLACVQFCPGAQRGHRVCMQFMSLYLPLSNTTLVLMEWNRMIPYNCGDYVNPTEGHITQQRIGMMKCKANIWSEWTWFTKINVSVIVFDGVPIY